MTALLANILPDPNSYQSMGWVLAVLFALGGGLLILKQLTTRTPSLNEEFVTRREFDRHVGDVKEKLQTIEDKGEARVIRIYDKIDEAAARQAEAQDRQTERLIAAIQNANRS